MDEGKRKELEKRLLAIRKRVEWIADEEARSAWINGLAAQGHFLAEKEHLLDESEKILDKLSKDLSSS